MKTEVYSWRLSVDLKAALETEARRQKKSLAALLNEMASQWLRRHRRRLEEDEAEQARIRDRAMKCVGTVSLGLGPYTNERVRQSFQEMWAEKRARNRPH